MDSFVVVVFVLVYLGMVLGRFPGLALDRTGIALLGALALLAAGELTLPEAWGAVEVPTIALLFGLMIVSAQFRLGGFYTWITRRIAQADLPPAALLALLVAAAGGLSALLANDIVCLAMAPILAEGCAHRSLDPKPFLIALACAANVGSAATLIGNPQNMLIGQSLDLSFGSYLLQAALPSLLGLGVVWWVIARSTGGAWHRETPLPEISAPDLNLWQTAKGLTVLLLLTAAFLAAPWPREIVALVAAGVLLLSRRMHTRTVLGLVDWLLLVLFIGLFVVNHALAATGLLDQALLKLKESGIDATSPAWLFAGTAVLSNLVSNVPAVMLLLPAASHELAGPVLALSSTLAGNLFIVGSIANIIVIDQAARMGIGISWREHFRIGLPVTVLTLAIAAGWLWIIS